MKTYIIIRRILLAILCLATLSVVRADNPALDDDGNPVYVTCIREGVNIYKEPTSHSLVVTTTNWLSAFVVLQQQGNANNSNWIKVGTLNTLTDADPIGWISGSDLLLSREAEKTTNGIYRKALIVAAYDKKTKIAATASARNGPSNDASIIGPKLSMFNIYQIYKEDEDKQSGDRFYLLGTAERIFDSQKPGDYLVGWVNAKELFPWDTREAAEYDKSTLSERGPVFIYETNTDLEQLILLGIKTNMAAVVATEDIRKTNVTYYEPRFPIIGEQNASVKMWNVGFIADEIDSNYLSSKEKIQEVTRLPNAVDIMFVFDGTGSMAPYKSTVVAAVHTIQTAAQAFWNDHYKGETKADLRFGITMYKDYICSNNYERLPLQLGQSEQAIADFINRHDFQGGEDRPTPFHGISATLIDTSPEFRKESLRAIFLIGDMGNMGIHHVSDERGYTTREITEQLRSQQCSLYAIHVASGEKEEAFVNFKTQTEEIISDLPLGRGAYLPLTSQNRIQEEIVNKVLEQLDRRGMTSEYMRRLGNGTAYLGDSLTGTIIQQHAIDIMKRFDINPDDFAREHVQPFGTGWLVPFDAKTGKRAMKTDILMNKHEVELLISLLGGLTQVRVDNIKRGWNDTMFSVLGESAKNDRTSPGEVIRKHMGIPVKSGVLNMSLDDIGKLSPKRLSEEINLFKRKLLMLRAVVSEKKIQIVDDPDHPGEGLPVFLGDAQFWWVPNNEERIWLDMEEYLP